VGTSVRYWASPVTPTTRITGISTNFGRVTGYFPVFFSRPKIEAVVERKTALSP